MVERNSIPTLESLAGEAGSSFLKLLQGHEKGSPVANAFTDQLRLGKNDLYLNEDRQELTKKIKDKDSFALEELESRRPIEEEIRVTESRLRIQEIEKAIITQDIQRGVDRVPGYLEANQRTMQIVTDYQNKLGGIKINGSVPTLNLIKRTTISIMIGVAKKSLNINPSITPTAGPLTRLF